jgi:hypothetical protein
MKIALLLLAACGKSAPSAPPPAAAPLLEAIRGLADQCDACKGDRECVRGVREQFDPQKPALLGNGARLAGQDKQTFDAELLRLRGCGDGAGLTFWVDE